MKVQFRQETAGIAAIEAAILFPLLILLVMAVIEFGMYFVKYQIATRAVSNISNTVQVNPSGATYALATQQGLSFLDLINRPNFICAKSYTTDTAANTGLCSLGDWQTGAPIGVPAGTPYFVAIRAYALHVSITPFTALSKSFPPPIDVKAVVQVGAGSSWTDIPLNDAARYDMNCEYRIFMPSTLTPPRTSSWYYVESVADTRLWLSNLVDEDLYVPNDDKSWVYITTYGRASGGWGYKITRIQRRCN